MFHYHSAEDSTEVAVFIFSRVAVQSVERKQVFLPTCCL